MRVLAPGPVKCVRIADAAALSTALAFAARCCFVIFMLFNPLRGGLSKNPGCRPVRWCLVAPTLLLIGQTDRVYPVVCLHFSENFVVSISKNRRIYFKKSHQLQHQGGADDAAAQLLVDLFLGVGSASSWLAARPRAHRAQGGRLRLGRLPGPAAAPGRRRRICSWVWARHQAGQQHARVLVNSLCMLSAMYCPHTGNTLHA